MTREFRNEIFSGFLREITIFVAGYFLAAPSMSAAAN